MSQHSQNCSCNGCSSEEEQVRFGSKMLIKWGPLEKAYKTLEEYERRFGRIKL